MLIFFGSVFGLFGMLCLVCYPNGPNRAFKHRFETGIVGGRRGGWGQFYLGK